MVDLIPSWARAFKQNNPRRAWPYNDAKLENTMEEDMKQSAANTSAWTVNEASLAQFAAKVAIVAFICAAAAVFVVSYADDVVRNRMDQASRIVDAMPNLSGPGIWRRLEKAIEDLADPKNELSPEKQAKLLAEIRTISTRWRPFIAEAVGAGTSEKPAGSPP